MVEAPLLTRLRRHGVVPAVEILRRQYLCQPVHELPDRREALRVKDTLIYRQDGLVVVNEAEADLFNEFADRNMA
jgi:hypothetical protein